MSALLPVSLHLPSDEYPHSDVDAPQLPSALRTSPSAIRSLWASVNGLEQQLGLRRQGFGAVQAEVEGICQSQEQWGCLDIGGARFHAWRGVFGGQGEIFFSMLVSREFPCECGSNGCIFIDQNPKHILFVLHYLHEGEVHRPVQEKELLREATYYGLVLFAKVLPRNSAM